MATVDRNNQALVDIENKRNQYLGEVQSNYDKMAGQASNKYNELIQAAKDYGQKTNQTIEEINQNKEKTQRDYLKEQKGAYNDYAQQTNQYGANAEQMAAAGLTGSGYQESSRVSMYNTYQNRVSLARQTFNDAIVAYDNQITQAQIANSAALAEIAYNALQTQLQMSIQSIQYENELLQQLMSQKLSINSSYDQLWQSMYSTLLGESQFNEQMAYQKQRDAVEDARYYARLRASSSKSSSKKSSKSSNNNSGGEPTVNMEDTNQTSKKYSLEEIKERTKWVPQPGGKDILFFVTGKDENGKNIGKYYNNFADLLKEQA